MPGSYRIGNDPLSLDHWENYYRGGLLATCPTGAAGSYDLEVRQAWVDFFKPLADDTTIVDVGTGNGAVILIARQTAAGLNKHWNLHGTDLARIDPVAYVPDGARQFSGVQFHPGTAAENLPFDDSSMDAICTHYVLEYTDIASTLAEFQRVLKSGGRAQFIVHHNQSRLVDSANWSIREAEIIKQLGVYRHLRQIINIEGNPEQVVKKRTDELRTSLRKLKLEFQHASNAGYGSIYKATLEAVQKLLEMRKQTTAAAVEKEIDRVRAELRAAVRRVKDLVKAARSEADMKALKELAISAGLSKVEFSPQVHAGTNLVGWRMTLQKD